MNYLKLLRPSQWIKNIFVFVPVIFARELFIGEKLGQAALAAVIFSCVASSMYIYNDICDQEQDRLHPTKCQRPIAAKKITTKQASFCLLILLLLAGVLTFFVVPHIWPILTVYIILNFAYSKYLKHILIADSVLIACFFVLRVVTGGLATDTYVSRWVILCTLFLSLFIVFGKRRAEFQQLQKRAVLLKYTASLLDQLLTITAALTIVAYGIYSVLGVKSDVLVYSTIPVVIGIFRYLYLIQSSQEVEYPEKILCKDKGILVSGISLVIFILIAFYLD